MQIAPVVPVLRLSLRWAGMRQDALEFFQYVLGTMEKDAIKSKGADISKLFRFKLEERLECTASNQVPSPRDLPFLCSMPASRRAQNAHRLSHFNVCPTLKYSQNIQVRYRETTESSLIMPVDLEGVSNKEEFEAYQAREAARDKGTKSTEPPVLPIIPFETALGQLFGTEVSQFCVWKYFSCCLGPGGT